MNKPLTLALKKAVVLAIPLLLAFAVWQLAITPLLTFNRDLDEAVERNLALTRHYRLLVSQAGDANSELQRLKENSGAEDLFYSTQNVNAAATLLQQKLGGLVAATGGQIRAARVETKPKTPNYEPFAVNLTFVHPRPGFRSSCFSSRHCVQSCLSITCSSMRARRSWPCSTMRMPLTRTRTPRRIRSWMWHSPCLLSL